MAICLCDNVYLVRGYKKDCIYNLNTKKLFHISKDVTLLLERYSSSNSMICSEKEKNMLTQLEKNGVIYHIGSSKGQIHEFPKASQAIKPSFAWVEICTSCNLKCKHCYNESSAQCSDAMSLSDFCETCSKLLDYGIKRIQLIGGEPLCHNNFQEMLEYVVDKFEFIEVFTNGTLLTTECVDFFKEHNIKVALSVYSYLSEEHDKVTSLIGSYQKTMNAIKMLKEKGVAYRIATTHMNDVEIGECDTDMFKINPHKDIVRLVGRGNANLLSPQLLKRKLITKKTFSYSLNPDDIRVMSNHHRCFSNKIYVSAKLEVYPCVMERRFSHGNLRNVSLAEIIKNNIITMNKDNIDECKECEFRYACYDCRPDSISNDVKAKPYYCTYNCKNGTWLDADDFVERFFENV